MGCPSPPSKGKASRKDDSSMQSRALLHLYTVKTENTDFPYICFEELQLLPTAFCWTFSTRCFSPQLSHSNLDHGKPHPSQDHVGKASRHSLTMSKTTPDMLMRATRFPFLLTRKRLEKHYAMYPDCPTLRGRRHVQELTNLASRGGLATIVFVAALSDIEAFKPNRSGDPEIPPLLRKAQETGVMVKAIGIHYDPKTSIVYLDDPDLKVDLRNS